MKGFPSQKPNNLIIFVVVRLNKLLNNGESPVTWDTMTLMEHHLLQYVSRNVHRDLMNFVCCIIMVTPWWIHVMLLPICVASLELGQSYRCPFSHGINPEGYLQYNPIISTSKQTTVWTPCGAFRLLCAYILVMINNTFYLIGHGKIWL